MVTIADRDASRPFRSDSVANGEGEVDDASDVLSDLIPLASSDWIVSEMYVTSSALGFHRITGFILDAIVLCPMLIVR